MWRVALLVLTGSLIACGTETDDSNDAAGGGGSNVGGGGVGGEGGALPVDCPDGAKLGGSEGADGLLTVGGIEYNVRVPADYQPTLAHPLLVVFSPRVTDDSASALEVFTGFTPGATARGYVVAYLEWFDPVADANRLDADTVRIDVADSWCIDETRVYYTGHSDGGSISTLLPLLHGAPVTAVAPSAAGIEEANGGYLGCDTAVPAMIIHSADDAVFPMPAHGIGAANHWASCFNCAGLGEVQADGCAPFTGCDEGGEVLYCEVSGGHYTWYGLNESMLDFFDRHERPSP